MRILGLTAFIAALFAASGVAQTSPTIVTDDGDVFVQWDTVPGYIYTLEVADTNGGESFEWETVNKGLPSEGVFYGSGQSISYLVHDGTIGGGGGSNSSVDSYFFTVGTFPNQNQVLVSWTTNSARQVLLSRDLFPENLPPVLNVDVPDGQGGAYELTLYFPTLTWQDSYPNDPALDQSSLSPEELTHLGLLTAGIPEIENAVSAGQSGGSQNQNGALGIGSGVFRIKTSYADSDNDSVPDWREFDEGTDPFNPDTDRDGFMDGDELDLGSDPNDPLSTPLSTGNGQPSEEFEKRYQAIDIEMIGDSCTTEVRRTNQESDAEPLLAGKYSGPDVHPYYLRRGYKYLFILTMDTVGTAQLELNLRHPDTSLRWWAQFGQPTTATKTDNPPSGSETSGLITLFPADIATDYDRNFTIDFEDDQPTVGEPFRFWLNDDMDSQEDKELEPQIGTIDFENDTIDTRRDLEDFAEFALTIPADHDKVRSGEIEVGLVWRNVTEDNPRIQVFRHFDEEESVGSILSSEWAADQQLSDGLEEATIPLVGATPVFFHHSVFAGLTPQRPIKRFLVEGRYRGTGELTVVIKYNGELGDAIRYPFRLLKVDEMYRHVRTNPSDANEIPDPYKMVDPIPYIRPVFSVIDDPQSPSYIEDPRAEDSELVFVHGWRATYEYYRRNANTFFKRVWHQGYKGHVTAFNYPTYRPVFSYNDADYLAWCSGPALKDYIDTIPSSRERHIVSHSLGSVVVASALEDGMTAEVYGSMNGSVPAMCFDALKIEWPFMDTPDIGINGVWSIGFANCVPETPGLKTYNYVADSDPALGLLWNANNAEKPQLFLIDSPNGYWYRSDIGEVAIYDNQPPPFILIREVTDPYEGRAFITQSRSKPLGVVDDVDRAVHLNRQLDDIGFSNSSDSHNAVIGDNIQEHVYRFYRILVKDLTDG